MENKNYGGLDSEFTAYETAEIVVLPVPYDGTSTWLKGADKGPDAILEASANMELYDIETDSEVYTHGIATLEPVTEASSPEAMSQEVEKQVDKILTDKKFPVILEESIPLVSVLSGLLPNTMTNSLFYNWMHIPICVANTKVPLITTPA